MEVQPGRNTDPPKFPHSGARLPRSRYGSRHGRASGIDGICPPPLIYSPFPAYRKRKGTSVDDHRAGNRRIRDGDVKAGTILLTQGTYTKAVLAKFATIDVHPTITPTEVGPVNVVQESIISPENTPMFRSTMGSTFYMSVGSRPDIGHLVLVLTKGQNNPGPKAMVRVERILWYTKGTILSAMTYSEEAEDGDKITTYADSDVVGNPDDRRLITGLAMFLRGVPVNRQCLGRTMAALSSKEVEYVVKSNACTMIIHFRHLMGTLTRHNMRLRGCLRTVMARFRLTLTPTLLLARSVLMSSITT